MNESNPFEGTHSHCTCSVCTALTLRIIDIIDSLGGSASKSNISMRVPGMPMPVKEAILNQMVDEGIVNVEVIRTGRRPRTMYST